MFRPIDQNVLVAYGIDQSNFYAYAEQVPKRNITLYAMFRDGMQLKKLDIRFFEDKSRLL